MIRHSLYFVKKCNSIELYTIFYNSDTIKELEDYSFR